MYFVYILKSVKSGKYYKGITDNISRRLSQHDTGECQTTRLMGSTKLIHVEVVESREKARIIEKYFKSGFGREIIKEIDENSSIS